MSLYKMEGKRSGTSLDRYGVSDRQKINQAYADFLDKFPWTHFTTFTTRNILTRKATRRLASKIGAKLITSMLPTGLKLFWVGEAFESRDGYHLHCLLYCPREIDILLLKSWYEASYGFCKILPKNERASQYVVKYLDDPNNEYDVILAN